ncbi:MAG TPA: dihydrofolate reductase family protein [Chloroflexota bacterium]
MRKIIAGMYITLDGIVEAPEQWNPPYNTQEMADAVQAQMAECDTHLYGRRSYELFRAVFTGPAADRIPHAGTMNDTPKIVVSTTLTNPDWGPTTVISSDVAEELARIKEQPGKNINVGASGTLVRFLLEEGLLDELRLHVHPVVVGRGKRLFEGGSTHVPLHLLGSATFRNGVVALRYARAEPAQ